MVPADVDAAQSSELPHVVRRDLFDDVRGEVQHLQVVLHRLKEGDLQRRQWNESRLKSLSALQWLMQMSSHLAGFEDR